MQPVHPNGQKWQISGGQSSARTAVGEPLWRADGRELYYTVGSELLAVEIGGTDIQPLPGAPKKLFNLPGSTTGRSRFVVSRDGQRFLAIVPEPVRDEALTPFVVIVNWPRLLENR